MSSELLEAISQLKDKEQLVAIARAVQLRLEELERDKGELHLILHKGEWYATELPGPDGRRRVVAKLGPKLSPAAVLKQAREPAPKLEAFELPKGDMVLGLKAAHPDRVGWWEDERKKRRYYDRPAYDQAKAEWRKVHDLATHPLALVYGIGCIGIAKLLRLEAAGFRLTTLPE